MIDLAAFVIILLVSIVLTATGAQEKKFYRFIEKKVQDPGINWVKKYKTEVLHERKH